MTVTCPPATDLLIRRFPFGRPDPFRPVRDLGLASARCSYGSGAPEGCSSAWLPAWLPAGDHLLRRSGQVVQDRPSPVVGWADIPGLSTFVRCRPAAWQQCWQQSQRNGADPPTVCFSGRACPKLLRIVRALCAAACCWSLLLLSTRRRPASLLRLDPARPVTQGVSTISLPGFRFRRHYLGSAVLLLACTANASPTGPSIEPTGKIPERYCEMARILLLDIALHPKASEHLTSRP
jgi:hypothetical protein